MCGLDLCVECGLGLCADWSYVRTGLCEDWSYARTSWRAYLYMSTGVMPGLGLCEDFMA